MKILYLRYVKILLKWKKILIFCLVRDFLNRKLPLHDRFDFFNLFIIIKYVMDKDHN